jgi:hypothetical protein
MERAGKAIIAFAYAVAVIAVPIFSGDSPAPRPDEWVQIGIAVVTAASVYLAPLAPGATWVKSLIGALLAALQVLTTAIVGGVDGNDVLMIVFAVAGALGIVLAPAASAVTRTAVGWGSDAQRNYRLAA